MEIAFSVRLPVDAHSVPFIRAAVPGGAGAPAGRPHVIDEIALALTEACANVVQHAGAAPGLRGAGRDRRRALPHLRRRHGRRLRPAPAVPTDVADSGLEGGRGLLLMRALVDRLDFQLDADGRHQVTLEKALGPHPALAPG